MDEKLIVPTFDEKLGFGDDNRNRVVGLHVGDFILVLDEKEQTDNTEHDVYIERRPGHWLVLIHPNGSDPVVAIEIRNKSLRVLDYTGAEDRQVMRTDIEPFEPEMGCPVRCERCEKIYDEARGEGYCGLCPECADATEGTDYHIG